jgi:adenylosuccinate synthase
MLNGIDTIALTKLDVLDDQPAIRVCVGYRYRGETLTEFPAELTVLENCEPVYKTFEGWMKSTVGALDDGDLPAPALDYIRMIENELGVPVTMISTGPRREETIVREAPTLARLTSGRLGAVIDQRQSG